jgi:hypothetical protein
MATAQGLREVFGRMGFGDRDIVALSGCHALGRCHPGVSGYNGVWTLTPRTFNNDYFSQLLFGFTVKRGVASLMTSAIHRNSSVHWTSNSGSNLGNSKVKGPLVRLQ